jgi:thymidylate synthase
MVVDPATKITNCHGTVIQCFVNERDEVDMVHYQRSCDMVCGYPHNALQYYAFLMWLAARAGREVGTLTHIIGDAHIYKAHWPLVEEMLAAKAPALTPQLVYTPTNREVFRADDWSLSAPYEPVINTKAELVV